MTEGLQITMICRSSDEPLNPGARAGYVCSICGARLQVTQDGRERMAHTPDVILLCNPCGLLYVHIAKGAGVLAGTETSPAAKAQLDQGNQSRLANWIRRHVR